MAQGDLQNGATEKLQLSFSALKPQLFVEAPKANDAVSFYKAAFGAEEVRRAFHPKRKAEQDIPLILSAELKLADFSFLVSDSLDTTKNEGNNVVVCLETEDVSGAIAKVVSAGGVEEGKVVEGDGACCGGRVGRVKDPYGFVWHICTPASKCDKDDA